MLPMSGGVGWVPRGEPMGPLPSGGGQCGCSGVGEELSQVVVAGEEPPFRPGVVVAA